MKRALSLIACLLAIAVPLAAQTPPPPEAILMEVLSLTDAQVTGLQALELARATAVASLQPQLQSAQQQLATALSSPAPDSNTVGQLVLVIHGLQNQIGQVQQAARDSFSAFLSDDQRSRVAAFHATQLALVAAGALEALGL